MAKTFLLCVGCQKGGTTWLHDYLDRRPDTDMGFLKEYHVLDALYIPECRRFIDRALKRARTATRSVEKYREATADVFRPLEFYANPETYYRYFRELADASDRVTLVGDITPSYSGLPIEALRHVRAELEGHGFDVKVVFLMRDPVERIWSTVRMYRRDQVITDRQDLPDVTLEEAGILRRYNGASFRLRTQYETTIQNLEAVFEPSQLHYEFYERLMNAEAIRRMTDFLGLPYVEPDFATRLNATETAEEISEAVKVKVARYYRPTYDFVAERFGRETVESLWPNMRYSQAPLTDEMQAAIDAVLKQAEHAPPPAEDEGEEVEASKPGRRWGRLKRGEKAAPSKAAWAPQDFAPPPARKSLTRTARLRLARQRKAAAGPSAE